MPFSFKLIDFYIIIENNTTQTVAVIVNTGLKPPLKLSITLRVFSCERVGHGLTPCSEIKRPA